MKINNAGSGFFDRLGNKYVSHAKKVPRVTR